MEGAKKQTDKLVDLFSQYEIYIERYYDHYLAMDVMTRLTKQSCIRTAPGRMLHPVGRLRRMRYVPDQ